MTRFNLFLDLMGIIHNLVQEGVTVCNANEAHMQMESVFDDFEENEGVDDNNVSKMFEDTFFKIEHLPAELKQYCYVIDDFYKENEIYLEALPTQGTTMEQAQLIAGLFHILNNLLSVGINSCNNHQARMEILALFNNFVQQEDLKTAQHLKTLLEEQEDIKYEARFKKILDDIATKEQDLHPELKECFQAIEDLPKSEDINDEDLQAILVVSNKCDKNNQKPQSINFNNFFSDLNDICDWSTFNI